MSHDLYDQGVKDGKRDRKDGIALDAFHAMLAVPIDGRTNYEHGYLRGYNLAGAYVEDMTFLPPYPYSMVKDPKDRGVPVSTTRLYD